MSGQLKSSDLHIGMSVEISPRANKSRNSLALGVIDEILTNEEHHSHGILVRLKDGTVGRVKRLTREGTSETGIPDPSGDKISIQDIIDKGENHFFEFKSSALWSLGLNKEEIQKRKIEQFGTKTSQIVIAKSIAAFLNGDGGTLLIGIKEVKGSENIEVIGIDSELNKVQDKSRDGYRRMLVDAILVKFFPSIVSNRINDHLVISFVEIDNRSICRIDIKKSTKPVFLTINNKQFFMVRIDASSREIQGEAVLEYCSDRFSSV